MRGGDQGGRVVKTRVVIVLAAFVLTFTMVDIASAQTPSPQRTYTPLEQVTPHVQPSVVYLALRWKGWVYDTYNKHYLNKGYPFKLDFQCTGFIVNPDGYVGTAGHCVDPEEVRVYFLAQAAKWVITNHYYATTPTFRTALRFADQDYRIEGTGKGSGNAYKKSPDLTVTVAWSVSVSGLPSGNTAPARVVSFKPFKQGDAALLKIEAQNLTPLLLADNADISTGTEVVSVGYPASVGSVSDANLSDPSFKSGTVSSIRTIENGLLPVYEVSSALSGGMSGGPTVDLNGDVIGVNSYSPRGETQQFNFIQTIQSLRELMADAGITGELGDVGTAYHEGLDAYFAGHRAAAVSAFRKVLQLQPSHPLAQQYLRLSQELPNPPKPAESSNLPWVLAGVGLLVAIALILSVVFVRRRRTHAPRAEQVMVGQLPGAPYVPPGQMITPDRPRITAPLVPTPTVAPPITNQPTQVGGSRFVPFVLRVRQGPDAGREFEVHGETVIGRQDTDLTISDSEMSARHAVVRPVNGGLEIQDLGSLNGTHVNGTRLTTTARLAPGDVIQIGRSHIEVVEGPDGDRTDGDRTRAGSA
jgi:serine protease Do